MRVFTRKTIKAYQECYPEADHALRTWVALIESRDFKHLVELKELFRSVDHISKDRVVFNIKGNQFRLVCAIDSNRQAIFIKWFGRHKDDNRINPSEVKHEYPSC